MGATATLSFVLRPGLVRVTGVTAAWECEPTRLKGPLACSIYSPGPDLEPSMNGEPHGSNGEELALVGPDLLILQ